LRYSPPSPQKSMQTLAQFRPLSLHQIASSLEDSFLAMTS
jgi:hypothetical protein